MRIDATECACPVEHTISKLGHCRTCPWFTTAHRSACVVETKCAHDFEWATYADDATTTGVCRCGVTAITYSMMVGP